MNNDRRKQIDKICDQMKELDELRLKLKELAENIKEDVESVRDDEQEYYDNMPEPLQGGDKGQAAEAAISILDDVINALDDMSLETEADDLITQLDEAKHQ